MYYSDQPFPQTIGSAASLRWNENWGVLDCAEYGMVFLYPRKVRMTFLALEVDLVPSDICCAQYCGDTRTMCRYGM